MAIVAVSFFSVKHFIPSMIERFLFGFEPLLLLLWTSRSGHKPSVEVISFQACLRYDECIIVRTVFLSRGGLLNSTLGIIVIGCLL